MGGMISQYLLNWGEFTNTICAVPVNLKDRDAFHLTIEEYLLALVSLIEELVSRTHHVILSFSPRHTDFPSPVSHATQ